MKHKESDYKSYKEKLSIPELYLAFSKLECSGWKMSNIYNSESRIGNNSLPIVALDNHKLGPAIWIIAGIHGEEPAGPNMLAHNVDYIAKNLQNIPTLILPLCNPQGYLLNQRYLNQSFSDTDGLSVGDASHKLPNKDYTSYRSEPTNPESVRIIDYLINESLKRPPMLVIDLHEDTYLAEGYIYSQGEKGQKNKHAKAILQSMEKYVGIQKYGTTRFNENIIEGVIGPVEDSSLDEFIASKYIYGGKTASDQAYMTRGIGAQTVLTIETPAKAVELDKRILAQQNALHTAIDIMRKLS